MKTVKKFLKVQNLCSAQKLSFMFRHCYFYAPNTIIIGQKTHKKYSL